MERAFAAFAWAGALFSLWAWWFARIGEPFDAGMAAWAALAFFIVDAWRRNGWKAARPSTRAYVMAAVGLAAYWASRSFLPISLCGVFGVLGGLALVVPTAREDARPPDQGELPAPLAGLAVAGLPTLYILDLFLGFPLRAMSTFVATALLRLAGLDVVRNGMKIVVGGVPVWVDAPCAGVKMLGTGVVLALVLAQVWRLRAWRTVGVCSLAVVAVCLSNAARVAVLTVFAAMGRPLGNVAHEAVGCVALLVALLLVACVPHGGKAQKGVVDVRTPASRGWMRIMAMSAFFAIATLCICVECMGGRASPRAVLGGRASSRAANDESAHLFPGWPETFEGDALVEEPQSEFEQMFAKNFPGRIGRFRAGRRTVILRWTTRPTHRVHGAAYCLRANGWEIAAREDARHPEGNGAWSAFRATRGGETLNVREQVRSADGTTFADVPTWFFNAFFGRSVGPWWIVTVAE